MTGHTATCIKDDKPKKAMDSPKKEWEGVHVVPQAKLHLAERADRKKLLVLFENGKYLMNCVIESCGALVLNYQ